MARGSRLGLHLEDEAFALEGGYRELSASLSTLVATLSLEPRAAGHLP